MPSASPASRETPEISPDTPKFSVVEGTRRNIDQAVAEIPPKNSREVVDQYLIQHADPENSTIVRSID